MIWKGSHDSLAEAFLSSNRPPESLTVVTAPHTPTITALRVPPFIDGIVIVLCLSTAAVPQSAAVPKSDSVNVSLDGLKDTFVSQ